MLNTEEKKMVFELLLPTFTNENYLQARAGCKNLKL